MKREFKHVEDYLSNGFRFHNPNVFVEVIVDVSKLVDEGHLKQTAGSCLISEAISQLKETDLEGWFSIWFEFESVPGGTLYGLSYGRGERHFGGGWVRTGNKADSRRVREDIQMLGYDRWRRIQLQWFNPDVVGTIDPDVIERHLHPQTLADRVKAMFRVIFALIG